MVGGNRPLRRRQLLHGTSDPTVAPGRDLVGRVPHLCGVRRSLAVIGAGAAAGVALHNSTRDREQKRGADELARWWDRFAWACDRAVSEDESVSRTGMAVLTGLIDAEWTRMGDDDMTVTIINLITDVGASDGSAGTPREGSRP